MQLYPVTVTLPLTLEETAALKKLCALNEVSFDAVIADMVTPLLPVIGQKLRDYAVASEPNYDYLKEQVEIIMAEHQARIRALPPLALSSFGRTKRKKGALYA
jgi:hypothetical protein